MATKTQQKQQIDKVTAQVAKAMGAVIDAQVEVQDNGRMDKLNADGEMLKCEVTFPRRPFADDPHVQTVNDQIFWFRRGHAKVVPWYVVSAIKDNVERKFRQEKDDQGKNVVVSDEMPTESFTYSPINPAPGVTV